MTLTLSFINVGQATRASRSKDKKLPELYIFQRREFLIFINELSGYPLQQPPPQLQPQPKYFLIVSTTSSGVKPNFSASTLYGAEAPKESIPIANPSLPTKRCQPKVLPASIETRFKQ
jgi:hypothetical protein